MNVFVACLTFYLFFPTSSCRVVLGLVKLNSFSFLIIQKFIYIDTVSGKETFYPVLRKIISLQLSLGF